MVSQFAVCYSTDGMDEVTTVEVFEPILVRIMRVGMTVEVMSRQVFDPILVTSVLERTSEHVGCWVPRTYMVLLFVIHEGGNGTTSVGTIPSLAVNTNGSTTNAEMVNGTRDSARRRRHCVAVM